MARAVAEGAASVEGCMVDVKRVAELVPEEIAKASGMKLAHEHEAPQAVPTDLAD